MDTLFSHKFMRPVFDHGILEVALLLVGSREFKFPDEVIKDLAIGPCLVVGICFGDEESGNCPSTAWANVHRQSLTSPVCSWSYLRSADVAAAADAAVIKRHALLDQDGAQ